MRSRAELKKLQADLSHWQATVLPVTQSICENAMKLVERPFSEQQPAACRCADRGNGARARARPNDRKREALQTGQGFEAKNIQSHVARTR
jgi:hypothetical protein